MYATIYFMLYLLIKGHKILECESGGHQSHCMLRFDPMDHPIALSEGSKIAGSVFSGAVIAIKYG